MTNEAMIIRLQGKNGIFRTENEAVLFKNHVTKKNMVDTWKSIHKELGKMLKDGEVRVDIIESIHYNRSDKVRLIIRRWENMVEYRPITRFNDFSDITENKFTTQKQQLDYTIKILQSHFMEIVGEIPENESIFAQSL